MIRIITGMSMHLTAVSIRILSIYVTIHIRFLVAFKAAGVSLGVFGLEFRTWRFWVGSCVYALKIPVFFGND